jgi:hypothetical protein
VATQTHEDCPGLKALLERTCPVDGVQASELGTCRVCGRQIVAPPEPDPVPDGVMRPVDPEKAALQKAFYARYAREKAEREKAEAERQNPKKDIKLLPGESLPGDLPKRDWAQVLTQHGLIPRW